MPDSATMTEKGHRDGIRWCTRASGFRADVDAGAQQAARDSFSMSPPQRHALVMSGPKVDELEAQSD